MKILFLRIPSYFGDHEPHPENVMAPVDISIMMAIAIKKNIDTDMIDAEANRYGIDEIRGIIDGGAYDYVVIKAKTPSLDTVKTIMSGFRSSVIGIGQLFATKSDAFFFDNEFPPLYSIMGEPEWPFLRLIECLINKGDLSGVPCLVWMNGDNKLTKNNVELLEDLDRLPTPCFYPFMTNKYFTYYPVPFGTKRRFGFLMFTRGCPHDCIFCSPTMRNSYGKKIRSHSVGRIINDMKILKDGGATIIQFRDDTFTLNRTLTENFCRALIREGLDINWIVQSHIGTIDEGLLSLMRKAGCISVGFGLESGSERVLNTLKKYYDIEKAKRIFACCRKLGIKTNALFLVGSPGEDKSDFLKTKELLKAIKPDFTQVALFTPYPGSTAYEGFIKDKEAYNTDLHHYNNYLMNFSIMSDSEVVSSQKNLYRAWVFSPRGILSLALGLLNDFIFNPFYALNYIKRGFGFYKKVLHTR